MSLHTRATFLGLTKKIYGVKWDGWVVVTTVIALSRVNIFIQTLIHVNVSFLRREIRRQEM